MLRVSFTGTVSVGENVEVEDIISSSVHPPDTRHNTHIENVNILIIGIWFDYIFLLLLFITYPGYNAQQTSVSCLAEISSDLFY